VTAVVLAAGRGARFAAAAPEAPPKLLADVGGMPLLAKTLANLRAGGATRLVVVIAPDTDIAVATLAADAGALIAVNSDPSRGMLSSVQAGLAAASGAGDACLVMPGDVPFVLPSTIAAIVTAAVHSGRSVAPRFEGRGGHPVALSGRLRAAVINAPASHTLKDLLDADDPLRLNVADRRILRDVDVPDDLSRDA
jgi:molybdenum cofactor cytidylyltransferase